MFDTDEVRVTCLFACHLKYTARKYDFASCFLWTGNRQSVTLSEQPVSEQEVQGGSDRSPHVALQQMVIIGNLTFR